MLAPATEKALQNTLLHAILDLLPGTVSQVRAVVQPLMRQLQWGRLLLAHLNDAPPAQAQWLVRQLAVAQIGQPLPAAASLRQRIAAFQASEGLPADGRAGPRTLMHLNRATGVDEPRLSAEERR